MKANCNIVFVSAMVSLTGVVGATAFTPVAIPSFTEDITGWTDGGAYAPLFPSSDQTLAGVPFEFRSDGDGNNVFFGGTLGSPAGDSLPIPVGLAGIDRVYAIMNTAWGQQDSVVGSMEFSATGGLTHSVELLAGVHVRDHYYGSFINTTTFPGTTEAVYGSNAPGNSHLDLICFDLPGGFAGETLTEIVFTSSGADPGGKAFLAALTVHADKGSGVPDGGSALALLAGSLGALLGAARLLRPRG